MKICVVSPYQDRYLCPVLESGIFKYIPHRVHNPNDADVIFLVFSKLASNINKNIFPLKKPYVIIDFIEYGPSWNPNTMETHIIGKNTEQFNFPVMNADMREVEQMIKENPPKLYFKRELKKVDHINNIMPIEYPCNNKLRPITTEAEFNKRFIDVFFCWGFSNETRPLLHAEIYKQSTQKRFQILGDWTCYNDTFINHVKQSKIERVWAPLHTHWVARQPMSKIIEWNGRSKITVALYGFGRKCFRHAECINTIMAKQDDGLSWSHAWKHGENCILLKDYDEFSGLSEAVERKDLFHIYKKGQENLNHYFCENYINNHVMYQTKKFV